VPKTSGYAEYNYERLEKIDELKGDIVAMANVMKDTV
jgi:hypothetical protein